MPTPSAKLGLALPSQPDDFSTADVRANWEKIDAAPGTFICTSTTRPTWGVNQAGRKIFETNTGVTRSWTGSSWAVYGYEPGDIKASARVEATDGWLPCDGRALNRSTYSHLFAAIGTLFNVGGEAATDFRIPNLVGRTIIGRNPAAGASQYGTVGQVLGSATVTIAPENLPPHAHSMSHTHTIDHAHAAATTSGESASHTHSGGTSDNGGHKHAVLNQNSPGSNGNSLAKGQAPGAAGEGWNSAPVSYEGVHQHTVWVGGQSNGHTHTVTIPAFSGSSGAASTSATGNGPGSSAGLSVMQPSVVLNYFIKI